MNEVVITRVMRGAEASTDHKMVRTILRLKIRPPVRKKASKPRLNLPALSDTTVREAFQQALSELPETAPHPSPSITTETLNNSWNNACSILLESAQSILGTAPRRHRDWFDENKTEIHALVREKNAAHDA